MPDAGADPRSTDPDPGHGVWRRTLISAWLAEILAITGFFFVMPFLRLYIQELGAEGLVERSWWAGPIIGAPSFVMGFMAPIWGVLADRVGRKLMVLRAMFGGAIVICLMGFVRTPTELLVLRLIQGATTGTITASAALVASVSPSRRAGFSLGMMQAAVFAGMAAGPLLGGLVWHGFGARNTFFAAAGLLVAGGMLLAVFAREGSAHPREARLRNREGPHQGILDVLRRPGFAGILAFMLVLYFSRNFPAAIFQEYAARLAGPGSRVNVTVGALHSVTFVAAALASVPMGWLVDRVGHKVLIVTGT
ncbi:MAG: MFS transporter, partial [Planctomycetota bacterium]